MNGRWGPYRKTCTQQDIIYSIRKKENESSQDFRNVICFAPRLTGKTKLYQSFLQNESINTKYNFVDINECDYANESYTKLLEEILNGNQSRGLPTFLIAPDYWLEWNYKNNRNVSKLSALISNCEIVSWVIDESEARNIIRDELEKIPDNVLGKVKREKITKLALNNSCVDINLFHISGKTYRPFQLISNVQYLCSEYFICEEGSLKESESKINEKWKKCSEYAKGTSIIYSEAGKGIVELIVTVLSSVAIPGIAPISLGVIAFPFFYQMCSVWKEKKGDMSNLSEQAQLWNELDSDERKIFSEMVDRASRMPPGTSYKRFMEIFDNISIEKIKIILDEWMENNKQEFVSTVYYSIQKDPDFLKKIEDIAKKSNEEILSRLKALEKAVREMKKEPKVSYVRKQAQISDEDLLSLLNLELYHNNKKINYVDIFGINNIYSENNKNLFIYGKSGCGKTRFIYEYIKQYPYELCDVWFIGNCLAGSSTVSMDVLQRRMAKASESGRQLIVWDNFPHGLSDVEDEDGALKKIWSYTNNKVSCIVVLNPDKLDSLSEYKNGPRLFDQLELSCKEKAHLRSLMIKLSDTYLSEEKKAALEDVSGEVANILYRKWNSPKAVSSFLIELQKKRIIDSKGVVNLARKFYKKEYAEYVQKELSKKLTNNRDSDKYNRQLDFLYALKVSMIFCKIRDSTKDIRRYQRNYFGSKAGTLRDIDGRWFTLKSGSPAMQDIEFDALTIEKDSLTRLFCYILDKKGGCGFENFLEQDRDPTKTINPESIVKFIVENHNLFQIREIIGLISHEGFAGISGMELSKIFVKLEDDDKKELLRIENEEFMKTLDLNLVEKWKYFSEQDIWWIRAIIKRDSIFTLMLARKICNRITNFSTVEDKTLKALLNESEFSEALGMLVGERWPALSSDRKSWIKDTALGCPMFSTCLANRIGTQTFWGGLNDKEKQQIVGLIERHLPFASNFGSRIGAHFSALNESDNMWFKWLAENYPQFAVNFITRMGATWEDIDDQDRNWVMAIAMADTSDTIAIRLGYGLGANWNDLSDAILEWAKKQASNSPMFAENFGYGAAKKWQKYSIETRRSIKDFSNENPHFGRSLTSWLIILSMFGNEVDFNKTEEDMHDRAWVSKMAEIHIPFAESLLDSIEPTTDLLILDVEIREWILEQAKRYLHLSDDLGHKVGEQVNWLELKETDREIIKELTKENPNLAMSLTTWLTIGVLMNEQTLAQKDKTWADEMAWLYPPFAENMACGLAAELAKHRCVDRAWLEELCIKNWYFGRQLCYWMGMYWENIIKSDRAWAEKLANKNTSYDENLKMGKEDQSVLLSSGHPVFHGTRWFDNYTQCSSSNYKPSST